MQLLADEHETARSELYVAPDGLGTDWTVQEVPFQASARGTSVPALFP
jgi:hypothetical protein